jgi:hypothetical protein
MQADAERMDWIRQERVDQLVPGLAKFWSAFSGLLHYPLIV